MSLQLFPIWRDLWLEHPGMAEPLEKAEAALGRRLLNKNKADRSPPPAHSELAAVAIVAARNWSNDKPPAKPQARSAIVETIRMALTPHLTWGRWVRWCELERTLLDASTTGDVVFGTSALRTMLEEIGRLKALDLSADEVRDLASGNAQAQAKLRRYLGAAWTSITDLSSPDKVADRVAKDFQKRIVLSARANAAMKRLNAFVHPNYGSHLAVLYPEGTETANVLLEAIGAVYEEFESLSFASEAAPPLPPADCLQSSRDEIFAAFVEQPLAIVSKALDEAPHPTPLSSDLAAELTRAPSVTMFEQFPTEIMRGDLPPPPTGGGAPYRSWSCARPDEVLLIALARRSERSLSAKYPDGAPETTDAGRLAYDIGALELAMLSTQAKVASLQMQLVRQTVAAQPLGIWLAARAMVEQWALVLWLADTTGEALDRAAVEGAGQELAAATAHISRSLGDYLASSADDRDLIARPWSLDSSGAPLGRLDLRKVTASAMPDDDFWGKQYVRASAVLHGRRAQALELATDHERLENEAMLAGTLIIARVCQEWDWSLGLVSRLLRLKHALQFEVEGSEDAARWSFGIGADGLREGADYSGAGTEADPFVLHERVDYYVGSRWLAHAALTLPQNGEEDHRLRRVADRNSDGDWSDHWSTETKECWTKVKVGKGTGRRSPLFRIRQ